MKRLSNKCWVLVADGARALVLRNDGDAEYPNLKLVRTYGQENPATRKQGTDRPGRTHESVGSGRSAMEPPDRRRSFRAAYRRSDREGFGWPLCDSLWVSVMPEGGSHTSGGARGRRPGPIALEDPRPNQADDSRCRNIRDEVICPMETLLQRTTYGKGHTKTD